MKEKLKPLKRKLKKQKNKMLEDIFRPIIALSCAFLMYTTVSPKIHKISLYAESKDIPTFYYLAVYRILILSFSAFQLLFIIKHYIK